MVRPALATALLALTLPLFALGCEQVKQRVGKLLVGSKCDPDSSAQCWGDKQALLCVDGKYVLRDCKGVGGCNTASSSDKTIVRCAWSEEQEGEKCGKDEDGEAVCGETSKTMVVCRDEEVHTEPCRGPKGCYPEGDKIQCDISISKAGDPCTGDGFTCAEDKQTRLACKDKKLVVEGICRGPGGCKAEDKKVLCDFSHMAVGDSCKEEGAGACSVDKSAYLECRGGKMVEQLKCKGDKHCSIDGEMVRCDWSIGDVGDGCNQDDAASCSGDGKAMLVCKNDKLVLHRKCPVQGCKIDGTQVICR
jgi:hypothetical protein